MKSAPIALATAAVAMGYRALKWDPFDVADLEMDKAQRRATVAIVEAVRAAVGPDIELMLDVHGRLNVPTAIAMCRALAPYDLTWIEEPTPPESIDALAEVRAASPVAIAAGASPGGYSLNIRSSIGRSISRASISSTACPRDLSPSTR